MSIFYKATTVTLVDIAPRTVIQKETGYQNIASWPLELSDFASTKAFADRFDREGGGRLDILVLNAGMVSYDYNLTGDGYETAYDQYFFHTVAYSTSR